MRCYHGNWNIKEMTPTVKIDIICLIIILSVNNSVRCIGDHFENGRNVVLLHILVLRDLPWKLLAQHNIEIRREGKLHSGLRYKYFMYVLYDNLHNIHGSRNYNQYLRTYSIKVEGVCCSWRVAADATRCFNQQRVGGFVVRDVLGKVFAIIFHQFFDCGLRIIDVRV